MGVGNTALTWHGLVIDEEARRKERAESARIVAMARTEVQRSKRVIERIERMTTLYRERLEGTRERE